MKLSLAAEEVALFFAQMLDHEYTTKDVFRENFFKDWRKVGRDEVYCCGYTSAENSPIPWKTCTFSKLCIVDLENVHMYRVAWGCLCRVSLGLFVQDVLCIYKFKDEQRSQSRSY